MTLIIVSTYNQDKYLTQCLDSILNQNNKDWFCIIADDCSTDNTATIVKTFVEKDNRFKHVRPEAELGTAGRMMNYAYKVADGLGINCEFETRIDGDNFVESDFLDRMLVGIGKNDFIHSSFNYIGYGRNGISHAKEMDMESLIQGNMIGPSILHTRAIRILVGGYDNKTFGEDWDFYLRVAKSGGKFKKIDDVVFHYRDYDENVTHRLNNKPILDDEIRSRFQC